MKYLGIIFSILFVSIVNAKELVVCKSIAEDSHTIVVKSKAISKFELIVYRAKHGHTFPPERRDVFVQANSNRTVVNFNDQLKKVKLSYYLVKTRTGNGLIGEFLDSSVSNKSIAVACSAAL